jgi:endonuclease YncB( thermonuclease family)
MKRRLVIIVCALLFCTLFSVQSHNVEAKKAFYAKVTKVIDGDSLKVRDEQTSYEIRLYGIDAPEYDQPYASEAKGMVKNIALDQMVQIIPVEWDKYNRLVAIVNIGQISVNSELLRNGLAWYYPKYCKMRVCGVWKETAKEARSKRKNLWSQKTPVAPWRWKQLKYQMK